MTTEALTRETVTLLEGLGLREYEARCFVALARLPSGTAREISEAADVPRPRVYDAVEQLEAFGLVESQEANPRTFRAVSIDEATETLRERYESRIARLRENIEALGPVEDDDTNTEVWTLEGDEAITSRAVSTVGAATQEVVLVCASGRALPERMARALTDATARGVSVRAHALSAEATDRIETAVPGADAVDWSGDHTPENDGVERVVLVDREALLVSQRPGPTEAETAVWTDGNTGLVSLAGALFPPAE